MVVVDDYEFFKIMIVRSLFINELLRQSSPALLVATVFKKNKINEQHSW
jgi:hypothetical protein